MDDNYTFRALHIVEYLLSLLKYDENPELQIVFRDFSEFSFRSRHISGSWKQNWLLLNIKSKKNEKIQLTFFPEIKSILLNK